MVAAMQAFIEQQVSEDPPLEPPTDPAPEPTTIALLGIGLAGLAGAETEEGNTD